MNSERITETAEHGEHIALYCINHPALRWSTKNIAPIGSRRIFFDLNRECGNAIECDCPASDLRAVKDRP